jgi:signal transduction histidine kinase
VRLRLTLLYGGLFLVSGVVLLAVTYLLVTNKIFGGQPVFQTNYAESPVPVPGGAGGPTIHITERSGPDPLRQLLILSGIALAVMLAVSVALGWLMAGRVLRPLRTITATTRQISEANLHQRLAVAGPDDELKDLADTIDGLLARLDAAFDTQKDVLDAQRRFVANASHELRGPLTRERAAIEVALADPKASTQSLRATFQRVLAATKQQERLLEALLALARGQAGPDRWERFDLAAVTDEVLLARHAEVQRRQLHIDATLDPTPALGDPRLAERLVSNLVDNAIRHNQPAGWVQIRTSSRAGRAELRWPTADRRCHPRSSSGSCDPSSDWAPTAPATARATAWACPSWPPSPPPTRRTCASVPVPTAASRSWSASPPPTAPHQQMS